MGDFLLVALVIWFAMELGLLVFKRAGRSARKADCASLGMIWLLILLGNGTGVYLGSLRIGYVDLAPQFCYYAGTSLILLGVVLRLVAILQLKQFFTVNVALRADHRIISSGLYRVLRHPSYTGSLISFAGLGISFSNWLSVVVIFTPVCLAFLNRIRIEEAELEGHFGEEYREYQRRTRRLIPGVW